MFHVKTVQRSDRLDEGWVPASVSYVRARQSSWQSEAFSNRCLFFGDDHLWAL